MTDEKACPQCGVENSLNSAFCSGCGSALNSAKSTRPDEEVMREPDPSDPSTWLRTDSAQSPQCPDEEVMLEIGASYYVPSKWLVAMGLLQVTANHLCFEGGTVKGNAYNIVIPLSDITRMREERFRLTPTLVVEHQDDESRFFFPGTYGVGDYGNVKGRNKHFIAFVTTQIDLMSRMSHPVTKDEIIEAYRAKVPKKTYGMSTAFTIHLIIFFIGILVLYVVVDLFWFFLAFVLWGCVLLYHFFNMRSAEIV